MNEEILKIVGITHVKGQFQGRDYDNLNFKVTSDFKKDSDSVGVNTDTIKVKTENALYIFNLTCPLDLFTCSLLGHLIGKNCSLSYNKFGQVVGITVIDNSNKGGVK